MVKPQTVIERKLHEPQAVFEELCETRRKLTAQSKIRLEGLQGIKRYNELTKEAATTREQKKKVELEFDEKEPSHKSRIGDIKNEIEAIEIKLMGLALEHFKETGKMLEVIKKQRNGGVKKVQIGFGFRQLSLF